MSYYPGQKPFTHPDLELKDPNKIAQQQQEFNSYMHPGGQMPQHQEGNIHHTQGISQEFHKNPQTGVHTVGTVNYELGKNQGLPEGFKINPNCKKCEGTGYKKEKNKICKECSKHSTNVSETCKKCNGTGYKLKDKTKKCKKCNL